MIYEHTARLLHYGPQFYSVIVIKAAQPLLKHHRYKHFVLVENLLFLDNGIMHEENVIVLSV